MATATPRAARTARSGGAPRPGRSWVRTAIAVLILIVLLFPMYWMVNAAFQPKASLLSTTWFPYHPSLQGFRTAFDRQGVNLLTSIGVSLGATAVSLVLATPAAYALAQLRLPGSRIVTFGVLVTQMIPAIVIANALYSLYVDLHLIDSFLGLVLANASHGIPFAVVLMRAFMVTIPTEVVEAARVDGAGRVRAFTHVVVPMSRNAIVTAGLFTFLFAWSDFLFALTLTTTGNIQPITLGLYQYIGTNTTDWAGIMAAATMACVPAAILLVAAQKFVAAGIAGGAVK